MTASLAANTRSSTSASATDVAAAASRTARRTAAGVGSTSSSDGDLDSRTSGRARPRRTKNSSGRSNRALRTCAPSAEAITGWVRSTSASTSAGVVRVS